MKKIFIKIGIMAILIFSKANATLTPEANLPVPRAIFAKFIQTVESGKKVLSYRGDFIVNGNNTTKWQYLSPTKKEICGKGEMFKVVDHDLEQATYYRSREAIDVRELIGKARRHSKDIYTTTLNKVTYTFRINEDRQIDQIVYKDNIGNLVRIKLTDIVYADIDIPEEYMECPTPSGYDSYGIK